VNNYLRFNAVGTVVHGSCQLDMTRWCDINKLTIIVCVEPGAGDAWKRRRQALDAGVLAFLQARLVPGAPLRARELSKLVRQELEIEIHPRTIERVLKKTGR